MFELKNVTKFYNNNGVVTLGLHNINLKLNKGEIVAITGDSGSGKSTLLNVITCVDTYEEGEILFYGNETSYFNQNDMDLFRQNNVSFIYQKYNIIESYTVLQNVMLPLLLSGKKEKEAKEEALKLIEKVGLSKRINNKGTFLSGGEKQRCVIARALATDSKILACDEPTGNLDSKTGEEIINLIKEVAKDRLVLIVTHNYDQVKDIVTRKISLKDGEIVEDRYIEKIDDDEMQKMELANQKIAKKTLYKLSMQNIVSTPKKTTFTSMIFLVVSLITLFLSLLIVDISYEASGSSSNVYTLLPESRLVVYDKSHNELDINKLNNLGYKVYENNFFEETPISYINIENVTRQMKLTLEPVNFKVKKGKEPSKDGDFLLILPKGYDSYWVDDFYDNDLKFYDKNNPQKIINAGFVTGIAYSSEVKDVYLMPYNKNPFQIINSTYNFNINSYYNYNNEKILMLKKDGYNEADMIDKTTIICPTKFKDQITFEFIFGDIYHIDYPTIEVKYTDEYGFARPELLLGKDYYDGTLTPSVKLYEASIYAANSKKAKSEIEKLGYEVTIPTHVIGEKRTMDLITLYMFMTLLVIALVGLFFISFAIMSRIYQSKTKDYGVLRALGMVKSDLGKMVKIETIIIGMLNALISLIIFFIICLIVPKFKLIKDVSFVLLLFYFVTIFLFAYFTARRFNSKLFKFSVSTKLKDGEERD